MFRLVALSLCLVLSSLPAAALASARPLPRLGIDYELLPVPQPTFASGKVEVAEVFSYRCHFCAEFQPRVNEWVKKMPSGVRWEYVPAVFGGSWDNFARAYFAADVMGVRKRTHDAIFRAIFVDKLVTTGSLEEIADLYARFGVDRAKFLATMQSFAVTGKLARARQFALNTGINGTPTLILNGKYRINVTRDRSYDGALVTLDFLLAKEGWNKAAPRR